MAVTVVGGPLRVRSRARGPLSTQRKLTGFLCVIPAAVMLLVLMIWPTLQSIYYSFTDWNGAKANWVGFDNYVNGLLGSQDFPTIALNSALVVLSVPIGVAVALIIAFLLASVAKGRAVFRAIYFAPIALSWVVIGLAFGYLLSDRGPLNLALRTMGLGGLAQDWLGQPSTALASLIVSFQWAYFGINVTLLFTGMTTADQSIIEAARIDGAGGLRLLRHIVMPQVRRYIELCLVVTMSAGLTQIFGLIYTMTGGGPGSATTTLEYALYIRSFSLGRFAQGSAFGVILFIICLALAALRLRSGARND